MATRGRAVADGGEDAGSLPLSRLPVEHQLLARERIDLIADGDGAERRARNAAREGRRRQSAVHDGGGCAAGRAGGEYW